MVEKLEQLHLEQRVSQQEQQVSVSEQRALALEPVCLPVLACHTSGQPASWPQAMCTYQRLKEEFVLFQ